MILSKRYWNRTNLCLIAGSIVGAVMAGSGGVKNLNLDVQDERSNVVAEVNDTLIHFETFEKHLFGLQNDKRNPITDQDVSFILERLIEEELLIQRGLEIGLYQSDPGVRGAIVRAMVNSIVADSQAMPVTASELENFYQENRSFFRKTERARLRHLVFRFSDQNEEDVRNRAVLARKKLIAGEEFQDVARLYGDQVIARLPDALLPLVKIREYLGSDLLPDITSLRAGEISNILRTDKAFHLIWMKEKEDGLTPPLSEITSLVEQEFRRRRDDRALTDYLAFLKDRAAVRRIYDTKNFQEQ